MIVAVIILAITCGVLATIVYLRLHKEFLGPGSKDKIDDAAEKMADAAKKMSEAANRSAFGNFWFETKTTWTEYVATCAHCGAKNRLRSNYGKSGARCGKCGLPFEGAPSEKTNPQPKSTN